MKAHADFTALISTTQSYKNLRQATLATKGPCVPYLGVWLSDYLFISEGNSSKTKDGLVNFGKLRLLASVLRLIHRFQMEIYPFAPVPVLHQHIETLPTYTDAELYAMSKERE